MNEDLQEELLSHGAEAKRAMMSRRMNLPEVRSMPVARVDVQPALLVPASAHMEVALGKSYSDQFRRRLAAFNDRADQIRRDFPAMPRFVNFAFDAMDTYEERIVAGEINTRDNWHDTYNALVWLHFPRAKFAIASLHADILLTGGEAERRKRSPSRDYLTLFDECGIVLVTKNRDLVRMLEVGAWRGLFVDHREDVKRDVAWWLLGHGTHDALHNAHVGLMTKALVIDAAPTSTQAEVDALVASVLHERARGGRGKDLLPIPLLGIPGLWPANENPQFYTDHAKVFRPRV
jgi:hypothetical protein